MRQHWDWRTKCTASRRIVTVLKLKKEETEHFAEVVLTHPVSRTNWMSSYLVMAFGGSAFILFGLGYCIGRYILGITYSGNESLDGFAKDRFGMVNELSYYYNALVSLDTLIEG